MSASGQLLVLPVAPRPYLQLVEALDLDSVKIDTKRRSVRPKKDGRIAVAASNDEKIPESGRNNALTSMAGSMRRRGMGETAIEAALQAENLAKCTPPLDASEVAAIAHSVARYEPAQADRLKRTFTDVGNAERFIETHGDAVRYSEGLGWLVWNGLCWERDTTGRVVELAKLVAKSIYLEGELVEDSALRVAVVKHSASSQSAARIKGMVELAQSDPRIVVGAEELDANDLLLGVANGVLDLQTGQLRDAQKTDLITRHITVRHDKKAKAPVFAKFLNTITQGDKALQKYLQRVVGYGLTGLTSEQCLFFLYGTGANGKSTFLNVITELLGHGLAAQTPTETLMAKRSPATNDLARLKGVRVVIANEIEDGSMMAESLVKQITGGDLISARFHYKEFFDFKPKFKLFIAGNHKPIIRGRDNGMWRRIQLIPFTAGIPPAQRDKALGAKLRAELPGILNWALDGCREWQKKGLVVPPSVERAVDDYRNEMDVVAQWLGEVCDQGTTLETPANMAYQSYKRWAEDNSYRPMSSGVFGREFETRFAKVKRKTGNFYLGVSCSRSPDTAGTMMAASLNAPVPVKKPLKSTASKAPASSHAKQSKQP